MSEFDIAALCEQARTTPELLEAARAIWTGLAPTLFADRPPHLSLSKAGSCRLALWAELHDKNDIPDGAFYARDKGTMVGAWYASLAAAALEAQGYVCLVEAELLYDGVPGHADLGIYTEKDCLAVVDFKTTAAFKTAEPHESKANGESDIHYCYQVGAYAKAWKAPDFAIARILGGGDWAVSWYDTDSWTEAIDAEIARLRTAEKDEPPEADPSRAYLCKSCLFGACERNRNERKPEIPLLEALEGSLPR